MSTVGLKQIATSAEEAAGDDIAGITNSVITNSPIKVTGKYGPLAVVAYPVDAVVNQLDSGGHVSHLGKTVVTFKLSGNVVNLAEMTENQETHWYATVKRVTNDHAKLSQAVEMSFMHASHSHLPGSRFWFVLKQLASNSTLLSKLLLDLGIEAVVDSEPGGGRNIIANDNVDRVLVFSPATIFNAVTHRVSDLNSVDSSKVDDQIHSLKRFRGEIASMDASAVGEYLFSGEVRHLLTMGGMTSPGQLLPHMKPAQRVAVLKIRPKWIAYLEQPSVTEQIAALTADVSSISAIKELLPTAVTSLVRNKALSTSDIRTLARAQLPDSIQTAIIKKYPSAAAYFPKRKG